MLDLEKSIATLVLDHSEIAPVLQRHRLDFCCRGHLTLGAACAERSLDSAAVAAELDRAIADRAAGEVAGFDARAASTPRLVAHIVAKHHERLRETLPFLRGLSAKVARVHGEIDPRLHTLDAAVRKLCETLPPHLVEEEDVLFPALTAPVADRARIGDALRAMFEDHRAVGELVHTIRAASEDFALPDWACNSYRTLFAELLALETDLLAHVHLENHVLMPRFT
jgi:regulator of cell morphogenesis and NO signaling